MSDTFDPHNVTRSLFGCCSWEEEWTPGIKEWGTPEQAYSNSYVGTPDYDALLRMYEEAVQVVQAVRARNVQLEDRNRELQRRDDYVSGCLV